MLGKDVQDQPGAVDHLDLDDLLERAQLPRGQLAVADDGVGAGRQHRVPQLGRLAGADIGLGVGLLAALGEAFEHLATGGFGQRLQLLQRVLGTDRIAVGVDPHQHDAFQSELAVLDLGDVLQVGANPGDPA